MPVGHALGCARGEASRGQRLRRPEQRLRRHTGVVGALSSGETALDDDDLNVRIEPAERSDEMLPARAGAEHHHGAPLTHDDTLLVSWGSDP